MPARCENCDTPLRPYEFDLCQPCEEHEAEEEWEAFLEEGNPWEDDS